MVLTCEYCVLLFNCFSVFWFGIRGSHSTEYENESAPGGSHLTTKNGILARQKKESVRLEPRCKYHGLNKFYFIFFPSSALKKGKLKNIELWLLLVVVLLLLLKTLDFVEGGTVSLSLSNTI